MPGAMFSAVMSAFFSISLTISSPFGDFRLIAIDFLLTLNWRKYQGSSSGLPGRSRRPGSPRPGFSILTTSAPNHASTSVQVVPASNCVKSTTLTPLQKIEVLGVVAHRLFLPLYDLATACAFSPPPQCLATRHTPHETPEVYQYRRQLAMKVVTLMNIPTADRRRAQPHLRLDQAGVAVARDYHRGWRTPPTQLQRGQL